jgi:cytochrome c6
MRSSSSSAAIFILLNCCQSMGWMQVPVKRKAHNLNRISPMDPKDADFRTQPQTAVPSKVCAATAMLSLSILLAAPQSAWSADVAKGAALFQANCAGCHAGGQNFVKEKKTLQKEALEKYLGTTDPVRIRSFVQNEMPHKLLPLKMDEKDYLDVASYVSDQALGHKW